MKKLVVFCAVAATACTIAFNPIRAVAALEGYLSEAPTQIQLFERWIHEVVERYLQTPEFESDSEIISALEKENSVRPDWESGQVLMEEETDTEEIFADDQQEENQMPFFQEEYSPIYECQTPVSMENLLVFKKNDLNSRFDAIGMEARKIYEAILRGEEIVEVDSQLLGIVPGTDLSLLPAVREVCELVINTIAPARANFNEKYGFEMRRDMPIGILDRGHMELDEKGNITSCYLVFNRARIMALYEEESIVQEAINILDTFLDQIRSMVNPSMNEREAFQIVSDWIINYFTYDLSRRGSLLSENLTSHLAVCEGYAKALYLACNSIGIPCLYLEGTAMGAHAWNQVCIDGIWYWSDITWADQEQNGISENYRLSENLWQDHILNQYQPVCSSVL